MKEQESDMKGERIMSINRGKKICIVGAGKVGATVAYTLAVGGICSEVVLIDVNKDRAKGEAMDIFHGVSFGQPVKVYSGDYEAAKDSDIVVITAGFGRKPGQSRIDLAQDNIDVTKSYISDVAKYAPNAIYVVVSNPVDIVTDTILTCTNLRCEQVIGSGTILDTARLRSRLAKHLNVNPQSIHAYVLGEHGDTAVIPWSLTSVAGMNMKDYCATLNDKALYAPETLKDIEEDVRTGGAQVIKLKGATFYAISMCVQRICDCILRDMHSVLTVSSRMEGQYGIHDVCISLPYIIGAKGIERCVVPSILKEEEEMLHHSANTLKRIISELSI